MVTDGWQQARDKVVQLWRRVRPEHAAAVATELDSTRAAVLAAHQSGTTVVEQALREEWGRRFVELLESHQDAEPALRAILADWEAAPGAQVVRGDIHLEAHAEGNGRVYMAARDQHITEQ
ncbi:hypothetical protein ACEZCY_22105 [Streptacidiphilus sp. N1-12]